MNVTQNNDVVQITVPVLNSRPYPDTNVQVQFTIPAGVVISDYILQSNGGSFNTSSKLWSIGTLAANASTTLVLTIKATDITLAPFTITGVLSGTLADSNAGNNSTSWVIQADTCPPAAGANPDNSGCLCIDVSTNDTRCSHGVTEWRLNLLSLVNGELGAWDELTGKGNFIPIDNSLPITGSYDLYCVQGINEYLIQQEVPFTISKQIKDKTPYNHTRIVEKHDYLSLSDRAIVQSLNPSVVDISIFCWDIMRNGDGQITSAIPLNCDPEQSTAVTYQDLNQAFVVLTPTLDVVFPTEAELGDIHIVTYTNGTTYFVWDGLTWVHNFHSKNIYPIGIGVTGTTTKTITITMSDSTTITTTFTDLDTVYVHTTELAISRTIIVANKQLTNSDANYHHIITNTPGLSVILPLVPTLNRYFKVKNSESSANNLIINGVTLLPGDIYEVIYDGVEWIVF